MSRIESYSELPSSLDFLLGKCLESFAIVDNNVKKFELENNIECSFREMNSNSNCNAYKYNGILIRDYNTNSQCYNNNKQLHSRDIDKSHKHYSVNYHPLNKDMTNMLYQKKCNNDKHGIYSRNKSSLDQSSIYIKNKALNKNSSFYNKALSNNCSIYPCYHKGQRRDISINNKEKTQFKQKKNINKTQSQQDKDNEEINTYDLSRFCTFAPNSSEESTNRTNKKRRVSATMTANCKDKSKAKLNKQPIKAKVHKNNINSNNQQFYHPPINHSVIKGINNRSLQVPFINDYVNCIREYRETKTKTNSNSNSNSRDISNKSVSSKNTSRDCFKTNKANSASIKSKPLISITKKRSLINLKEFLTNIK